MPIMEQDWEVEATSALQDGTTSSEDGTEDNLRVTDIVQKVLYLLIGASGILANILVVIVIAATRSMRRKLPNMFILNQSIIDFCASIVLVTSVASTKRETMSGLAGHILCRFWLSGWLVWSMFMTSTYNLLALTLERYFGVVHSFWHRRNFTRKVAFILMFCSWLIGPIYQLYMPLTARMIEGRCYLYHSWASATAQRVFGVLTVCLEFIIPFIIMLYCYIRMILVVRASTMVPGNTKKTMAASVTGTSITGDKTSSKMSRAKQNIIITLVIVCVCFVLCWCWNELFFLTFNLGIPIGSFSGAYYHFSVIAIYCNCCVNPVVYSLKYLEFQRAALRLMGILRDEDRDDSEFTSQGTITTDPTHQDQRGQKHKDESHI